MHQAFIHFHAAGNHQRHLMIAVECLLQHLEAQKIAGTPDHSVLNEELMELIVHLSNALTVDMEKFTWTLLRHADGAQSVRQFREIEGPCHQLLDANLGVVDIARALTSKHGYAPRITSTLVNISARTRWIHAQMCAYTGFTASSP